MAADKKLGFQVVFASGEDPDYPVTELNYHSPQTKGWQSPRFCEYPQEIGIAFTDGLVSIHQVQLLSHQSKIATKIELFQGTGDDYFTCQFQRLGYLSLDSNERSQFKARELKSVFLKAKGTFLKLLLHKCYVNQLNLFNQVGLVAINVLGQPAAAVQSGGLTVAGRQGVGQGRGAGVHDLAVDMGMDPETAAILRSVVDAKNRAVESEDFEYAKRLKVLQEGIKRVGGTLANFATEKARAIEEEDYDRAARLKDEMGRIRGAIFEQMADLGLPLPPSAQAHMQAAAGGQGGAGGPMRGRQMGGPGGEYGGYSSGPHGMGNERSPMDDGEGAGPGGMGMGGDAQGGYGGEPVDSRASAFPTSSRGASAERAGQQDYGQNAPGSSDRPIRPAATNDIYARATGRSPNGATYGGDYPEGGGMDMSYGGGRPGSRAIRPARHGQVEEVLSGAAGEGASPFGKRAGAPQGGTGGESARGRGDAQDDGMPERADPSQLAGVSGAQDLPAPDPLPGNPGETAGRLSELYGEYIARCFLSRAWNLRDAAVQKIALDAPAVASGQGAGPAAGSSGKSDLLTAGAGAAVAVLNKDRIANVIISTCQTLIPTLAATCCTGPDAVRRSEAGSALEPVLAQLLEKIGDNTVKIREAAVVSILALAEAHVLGVGHVANVLLRKPSKKQAGNLRMLQSKLEVLTLLIEQRGLLATLGPEALVQFCEESATFAHANGEIRHATLQLQVAAAKAVGVSTLEPMLQPLLRKKQMEDYHAAFQNAGLSTGGPPLIPATGGAAAEPVRAGKGASAQPQAAGKGAGKQQAAGKGGKTAASGASPSGAGGKGGAGGGAAGASAPHAPQFHQPQHHGQGADGTQEGGEQASAEGVCQFCGGCGPAATEQELDLHYWQSCPMLTSCTRCQQVVEIATLSEHLLDECEHKEDYEACGTCGDAVLRAQLPAHEKAGKCKAQPDPAVANRCPLCHKDIGPEKEGWLQHLLDQGCSANPRTNKGAGATPA